MAAPTTQQKLRRAQETGKTQLAEIIDLRERLAAADERAKNADIEAAKAIREKDEAEKHLEATRDTLDSLRQDLATIRGYVQRVNQVDNAHHPRPEDKIARTEPGQLPNPKVFELPETNGFDRTGLNEYMRNR